MLSLIEPGGKRSHHRTRSSDRHLLSLAATEDDDFYENTQLVISEPLSLRQRLSGWLVGNSNSLQCSDRWKRDFSQRPSWCDADMALQQIRRGKARGNRVALYARAVVQKALFGLGSLVQRQAMTVLLVVLIAFTLCCYGLQFVRIENDIVKLWVPQGGILDEELNFLSRIQAASNSSSSDSPPRENGIGGGYQVLIQTQTQPEENILSREGLLRHVALIQEIADYTVSLHDRSRLLLLAIAPLQELDPVGHLLQTPGTGACQRLTGEFLRDDHRANHPVHLDHPDRLFLGGLETPGSKSASPSQVPLTSPGLDSPGCSSLGALQWLSSIPADAPISWRNLNPGNLVKEIAELYEINTVENFFQRSGIGNGYMDRWCMDPLDVDCPRSAPNYFDICPALSKFQVWNAARPEEARVTLEAAQTSQAESDDAFSLFGLIGKRKKRESALRANSSQLEEDPATASGKTADGKAAKGEKEEDRDDDLDGEHMMPNATECRLYGASLRGWMNAHPSSWSHFLTQTDYPRYPDYPAMLNGGCRGFAKTVMSWPEDLIVGGARREGKRLVSAEALQSIFLVASENDVYLRHKSKMNESWSVPSAAEVVRAWQRNFTRHLYDHDLNANTRIVHPLASTSIADMLDEFCQFNYAVILVGYALMLVYAVYSQLHREGWRTAVQSSTGLGFAGVLTVTFASIAGLGLATWFGIEFNAATTQIVPFLTLGIGVDNMFLLLHNYNRVVSDAVPGQEIGILMKETGMSVLITSINNILSFLAGTILPIPALRSFCAQSSILLSFNLIAIMTLYPAIMSLDLLRRKRGRRDLFCCCRVPLEHDFDDGVSRKTPVQEKRIVGGDAPSYHGLVSSLNEEDEEDDVTPWTLHAFLRHYYIPFLKCTTTKVSVIVVCAGLLLAGIVGMCHAPIGLELYDVLPDNTAPAAFLKARDRYFSFYPMIAVVKGADLDLAVMQHKIDDYRLTIGKSRFVVRNEDGVEPSEKYWLGLMRHWLVSLQRQLDMELAHGAFNTHTGNPISWKNVSHDALLARRLLCSTGQVYNCTNRLGRVRLVDASGTINGDGFYNYLTAWCNEDSMMYYVSQAAFFPAPPNWSFKKEEDGLIPPAVSPAYSQIPFYLTGLTDTPIIVEMIREIRAICTRFANQGLPNFPGGVAFTFWDQYLHLEGTLLQAIGVISLAVFVVISLLLCNPWAAGLIVAVLLVMSVELAGFLGIAGVKLNPISAVTLITAVGIGVEFTAHVVLAFLTALGSRNDRMASCIDRVFVPVIHGALSTLLGIIMLAFSEFDFVVKYFFVVMSALIVIGLINGLALLPVLLSLIGPPCEVTPVDGSDRLPPPPPRTHRKTWSQEMRVSSEARAAQAESAMKCDSSMLPESRLSHTTRNSLRAMPTASDIS